MSIQTKRCELACNRNVWKSSDFASHICMCRMSSALCGNCPGNIVFLVVFWHNNSSHATQHDPKSIKTDHSIVKFTHEYTCRGAINTPTTWNAKHKMCTRNGTTQNCCVGSCLHKPSTTKLGDYTTLQSQARQSLAKKLGYFPFVNSERVSFANVLYIWTIRSLSLLKNAVRSVNVSAVALDLWLRAQLTASTHISCVNLDEVSTISVCSFKYFTVAVVSHFFSLREPSTSPTIVVHCTYPYGWMTLQKKKAWCKPISIVPGSIYSDFGGCPPINIWPAGAGRVGNSLLCGLTLSLCLNMIVSFAVFAYVLKNNESCALDVCIHDTCMHGCMDACMITCVTVSAWKHARMHAWVHSWMHAYLDVCIDFGMHTSIHACSHA